MAVSIPSLSASEPIARQDFVSTTPNQLAWRRFRRNRLALIGCVIIGFWVFIFLAADVISPFTPNEQSESMDKPIGYRIEEGPKAGKLHLLGTDNLGRDTLTRLMHGIRVSLSVGFVAEAVIISIGVPLGLLAGYYGGRIDQLIMRFGEVMNSFPDLLLLIILTSVLAQRSVFVVFIALGLTSWVTMSRLVRGQVLQVKQMDYVTGARSIGAKSAGMMRRHILPNILGPIIVLVTLGIPGAILYEATLTFLGVGVDPSTVTWGTMIVTAQQGIFSHPEQVLIPALALATLTLGMTFIGDGVRDAFDPKSK